MVGLSVDTSQASVGYFESKAELVAMSREITISSRDGESERGMVTGSAGADGAYAPETYHAKSSKFPYQKGISIGLLLAVVYNRKDYMSAMETEEVDSRARICETYVRPIFPRHYQLRRGYTS